MNTVIVDRLPVPGEVWTIHSPRDRTARRVAVEHDVTDLDVWPARGLRRVVAVADGLVTFWQTWAGHSEEMPGVKSVVEFVEQCRAPEEQ